MTVEVGGIPASNAQKIQILTDLGAVQSVGLTTPGILAVAGSPVTTSGTLALSLVNQAINTIFAGPASGGSAAPTFRAMTVADLPAGAGTGTVTSVGLTLPAILTVSGSPVTTSGILAASLVTQAANIVFAGPATGAAAAPTFRALAASDMPAGFGTGTVTSVAATVPAFMSVAGSPVTTSGTLAFSLSGTALPVANGGTGATSLTAYAPVFGGTTGTGAVQSGTAGTSGQVLTSNGAGVLPTFQPGGTVSPLTTKGDVYTFSTVNARLAVGTNGYALTADSTQATGLAWTQVGYLNLPQNSQSASYTTVLADQGKHLLHPAADTTARTFTIDANATVAYPLGTAITFVNQNAAGVLTIAINSDTMRLAGPGTTGSRTLAANGVCTAVKITTTEWIISGTGLA